MKYKFWHSLLKALIKGGVFAIPIAMSLLPKEWMNITLGTAAYMVLDYLQKLWTTL